MEAVPIDIPAGVVVEASKVRNKSNWREAHMIRWDQQTIRPIEGWQELTMEINFASKCRKVHKWQMNNGTMCIAYLCEQHIYADIGDGLIDITPIGGMASPIDPLTGGYGDDVYGSLTYGTPRPGRNRLRTYSPEYSLDNWGDELRAMTSPDGRYLKWVPSTPLTKAVAVTGAATGNRSFTITAERHAMIFGHNGKPDSFAWSDQENDSNWTVGVTSRAGFYDLEPSSPIVAHCKFFGGILIITPVANYLIRYIGLPYVYSYDEVGNTPIPVSPQSITAIPDGVIWPSVDGIWVFNGTSAIPVSCPIWDFIKDRIDFDESIFESCVVHIFTKSEVWWFYSTADGTPGYTHRVGIFNYRTNWWSMGKLSRSCGLSYGNDPNPIMSDGFRLYKHETGWEYFPDDMPWIESFSLNVNNGNNLATIDYIVPEISDGAPTSVEFQLIGKMDRTNADERIMGTARQVYYSSEGGKVDFRETYRDVQLRIAMVEPDNWSIGPVNVAARQRGKK